MQLILISLFYIICTSIKHDQSWKILNKDSKDYAHYLKEFNNKVAEGQKYEYWDFLNSRLSRAYRCIFYEMTEKEQLEVEKDHSVSPQFYLEGLRNNCLYRFEGFWAYEFCYGKHVRQFHAEQVSPTEQKVTLNFYLGYAPETEDIQDTIKNSVTTFSETYPGGTTCDLSNQKRSTKIIYLCDTTKESHILSVTEPSSCLYEIIISTPLICKHPKYKQEIAEDKNPIICLQKPLTEEGISESNTKEEKRFNLKEKKVQTLSKFLQNKDTKVADSFQPLTIKIAKGKIIGKSSENENGLNTEKKTTENFEVQDFEIVDPQENLKSMLDNPLIDQLIRQYMRENSNEMNDNQNDQSDSNDENPDLELVEPEDNDFF